LADDAASIADVAADEAAFAVADVSVDIGAGVTIVVVEEGVVVMAEGVVVVVLVVSSFLLQAAKETAAARVTISSAVFMFLLVLGSKGAWILGSALV